MGSWRVILFPFTRINNLDHLYHTRGEILLVWNGVEKQGNHFLSDIIIFAQTTVLYIIWSVRSCNIEKLCQTKRKKITFYHIHFPHRIFSKTCIHVIMELTIFLTKNNFPACFFSWDICQKEDFFFSPSTASEQKSCQTSSTKQ